MASPTRTTRPTRRRVASVLGLVALGLVVALVATVAVVVERLEGNLDVVDVEDSLSDRPADDPGPAGASGSSGSEWEGPIDVLVMGSDSRDGAGNDIDGLTGSGARSDTTVLLHVSADRQRAQAVSIPRDSVVDRPACDRGDVPAETGVMWNAAFAVGGPACTIQQVEQLTGVRVDHFVVVDFAGFRGMVDAVGGVEVCIPEDVDDREHGIVLEAGDRTLGGREALAYVRQRYAVGDGSDLGRIRRQQEFAASLTSEVLSGGLLRRPDRLVSFADAATRALTVDPGLSSVGDVVGLARELRGIPPEDVTFLTVPWRVSPEDPNRVEWTADADRLWRALRRDREVPQDLLGRAVTAPQEPRAAAGRDRGAGSAGTAGPDAEDAGLCG